MRAKKQSPFAPGVKEGHMSPARKTTQSSRSTAAKKAAVTRKAKSAKRSTAAKKAATTRRAGTTKAARASSAQSSMAMSQARVLPTEAEATGMDAVTVLESDHQTVDQLFRQYENLADPSPTARREPVDRFIREL